MFLSFSPESIGLRTRFRDAALGYIFRTAVDLSGGRVVLGEVGITEVPDEDDSWAFDLTLTVHGDWEGIEKLRREVLVRLEEWSRSGAKKSGMIKGGSSISGSSQVTFEASVLLPAGRGRRV